MDDRTPMISAAKLFSFYVLPAFKGYLVRNLQKESIKLLRDIHKK